VSGLDEEGRLTLRGLMDRILDKSSLAQNLKSLYEQLQTSRSAQLLIHGCIACRLSTYPIQHIPAPPPHCALALLWPIHQLQKDLPIDSASSVRRLCDAANPHKSLKELVVDLCIPVQTIIRIAQHLVYWRAAKVVDTLQDEQVYSVISVFYDKVHQGDVMAEYVRTFPTCPPLLQLFSLFTPQATVREVRYRFISLMGRAVRVSPDNRTLAKLFDDIMAWLVAKGLLVRVRDYFCFLPPSHLSLSLAPTASLPSPHPHPHPGSFPLLRADGQSASLERTSSEPPHQAEVIHESARAPPPSSSRRLDYGRPQLVERRASKEQQVHGHGHMVGAAVRHLLKDHATCRAFIDFFLDSELECLYWVAKTQGLYESYEPVLRQQQQQQQQQQERSTHLPPHPHPHPHQLHMDEQRTWSDPWDAFELPEDDQADQERENENEPLVIVPSIVDHHLIALDHQQDEDPNHTPADKGEGEEGTARRWQGEGEGEGDKTVCQPSRHDAVGDDAVRRFEVFQRLLEDVRGQLLRPAKGPGTPEVRRGARGGTKKEPQVIDDLIFLMQFVAEFIWRGEDATTIRHDLWPDAIENDFRFAPPPSLSHSSASPRRTPSFVRFERLVRLPAQREMERGRVVDVLLCGEGSGGGGNEELEGVRCGPFVVFRGQ